MAKIVIASLQAKGTRPSKAVTKMRVRLPDGRVQTIWSVDANGPDFGSDLTYIFRQNVAQARRENKRVTGLSDFEPQWSEPPAFVSFVRTNGSEKKAVSIKSLRSIFCSAPFGSSTQTCWQHGLRRSSQLTCPLQTCRRSFAGRRGLSFLSQVVGENSDGAITLDG